MPQDVIRNTPLSVLVVLADAGLNVAPLLSALRPHSALVCTSPAQGVEAARQFEPDVVLIDLRVPHPAAVIRNVSRAAGGRKVVFVALPLAAGPVPACPLGFQYTLPLPATAGEMEHLLWEIGRDLAAHTPDPATPPGSGMIG